MQKITLKSGIQIPAIGLGTFNIANENFNRIIHTACDLGYQLFDTATGYENHPQLAAALNSQKAINPMICTKFNNGDLIRHKTIEKVISHILDELEIQHIDFLLLHNTKIDNFTRVFKDLISLKKSGIIKSIGVSNFTIKHLDQLEDVIEHVDINQIELHPFLTQEKLIQHCKERDIKIIAYRPFGFGSSDLFNNGTLKTIAEKHRKTTAHVILRWLLQKGCFVIPKASNAARLKENIDIFDFILSEDDTSKINSLDKGMRTCTGPWADFDES